MRAEITTDVSINWRGGAKPLITNSVICEAKNGEEWHRLTTIITTALGQMEHGNVKKIIIKKLNLNE